MDTDKTVQTTRDVLTALRRFAVAVALATTGTLAVAPTMAAAASNNPSVNAQSQAHCPNGHAKKPYPPKPCQASTSSTEVPQGGTVVVTGDGFSALEPVTIDLHSRVVRLADVTSTVAGAVSVVVTIPRDAPLGQHTLVLTGLRSTNRLTAGITVIPFGGFPHTGNGLAFTGAALVVPLALGGLTMVGAGGLALVAVRRRRRPLAI